MNRTILKIRKINSSLAFLLATVLGIASCLTFIVNKLLINSVNPFDKIPVFEGSQLSIMLDYFLATFNKFEVFFVIFSLFSLVSLIFFYVSNRVKYEEDKTKMITKPFSIFKTIEILGITGFYLYATYYIVNSVLDIIFNPGFKESTSATANFINVTLLLVLYIVIFIVLATYYSKLFKTIKCVKKTVKTGIIMGRVSTFVIFMNFVFALAFISWAVFCIANSDSFLIIISKILMAVSFVLFSLYLIKLRKATWKIIKKGGENADEDDIENYAYKEEISAEISSENQDEQTNINFDESEKEEEEPSSKIEESQETTEIFEEIK